MCSKTTAATDNSSSSSSNKNNPKWKLDFLLAYLFCGLLHELSHVGIAYMLGYESALSLSLSSSASSTISDIIVVLFGMIVGRSSVIMIPSSSTMGGGEQEQDGEEYEDSPSILSSQDDWNLQMIQHTGWIFSCLLWLFMKYYFNRVHRRGDGRHEISPWLWAAAVTAIEAISTDLLRNVFHHYTVTATATTTTTKTVFFCGNFGIILLNQQAWTNTRGDYGKTALDLLEKMAEVTMMRGAQTGGVVTWVDKKKNDNSGHQSNNKRRNSSQLTPIRVRVVNGKRTDLSQQLRKALNRQVCSNGGDMIHPTIQCLMGHTRFATSSKATLDGTHPHQWSPSCARSVYPLDDAVLWRRSTSPKPVIHQVTNYITHNGDLDFFKVNGVNADLQAVQLWLEAVTGFPMPAPVDSAVIAGLVDVIRCAGCFALSLRFAHVQAVDGATISNHLPFPTMDDYARLGKVFETWLPQFCTTHNTTMSQLRKATRRREEFSEFMLSTIGSEFDLPASVFGFYYKEDSKEDLEMADGTRTGASGTTREDHVAYSLPELVRKTIDAFLDNDLLFTTKYFMKNAVGSFGLMITSSLDATRQICIAARGQPMSVAFYPEKGLLCYGSELAAVKAGMTFALPGKKKYHKRETSFGSSSSFKLEEDITESTCRYDLDDLGGEVVLLDYSGKKVEMSTFQESVSSKGSIRARVTPLKRNEFLIPLTPDVEDQILDDIQSIPRVLDAIQSKWKEGGLNRMTAWNLGRCLKERLKNKLNGNDSGSVDILLTGCEVSLYLAEQLASDLQKSFPKLRIRSTSSNKLLGVFGQELSVPSVGFPMSAKIPDMKNSIVIIVSHSGGTFAPLAIANLLQSVTKNIFVVASEWDTQIGKQLRLFASDQGISGSRVFSTDIGVRQSEPCSLSVCATHQLLTQLFEHICLVILDNHQFRVLAGAIITEQDLKVLEKCNFDNILALERTVGFTVSGKKQRTEVHQELISAGDLWADHVLEVAKAYLLSFLYIVGTVTAGYPLVTGVAIAAGMTADYGFYITRFLDSLIYFFLPQINITIIRWIQGRNLLHRMTGRTVVIGDIPWVSQCADAFLSKIFARSYSIAGLNVLSSNATDHLVHRMTHRIVRGTLLICGRPDGRLTALTSAECSVNLSVSQASSIQSLGGTCESITIGHNPAKLQLTKMDIALGTHRPKFLCEQILDVIDNGTAQKRHALASKVNAFSDPNGGGGLFRRLRRRSPRTDDESRLDQSLHSSKGAYIGIREQSDSNSSRSLHGLKGAYLGLREQSESFSLRNSGLLPQISRSSLLKQFGSKLTVSLEDSADTEETELPPSVLRRVEEVSVEDKIFAELIEEKKYMSEMRTVFNAMDVNGDGMIDLQEFIAAYTKVSPGLSVEEIEALFHEADVGNSGALNRTEFEASMALDGASVIRRLQQAINRDEKGLLQVQPSTEEYFGADTYSAGKPGITAFAQEHSQHFSMELYESRVASLQRFVAMCVMFHQMGKRVQDFFPRYSAGIFGYKMNRTHSILRIATTASPISGDAVREQMERLRIRATIQNAVHLIMNAWNRRQQRLIDELKMEHSMRTSLRSLRAHDSSRSLNCELCGSFSTTTNSLNGNDSKRTVNA